MKLTRRAFLQHAASMPLLAWLPRLSSISGGRSLILLSMDGGLTHLDTFDGKPGYSLEQGE